jgi:DNA primase RepB-like protein/primase-like protein
MIVVAPATIGQEPSLVKTQFNLADAARFLKLLDPAATRFEFRTFDDDKSRDDKSLTRTFYGTMAEHAAELKRLNSKGAGVFVTVNETDGRGRSADHIIRVRAVFIDLDGAPLAPVMALRSQPHMVVETSPGKFHAYWLVDGMPLHDFSAVQKALIELFQSDDVIHDLPRVMRLPGFYHHKHQPFLIRIHSTQRSPPYPERHFRRAPAEPHHASRDKEPASQIDLVLAAAALEIIPTSLKWNYRNYIGMATWLATDGQEEGFAAWGRWLQRSGQFDSRRAFKRWQHYFRSPPDKVKLGTLIFLANQIDPEWRQKLSEFWRVS